MFNLEYWIGSRFIEIVMYNKPRPILIWKMNQLKITGNYNGKFKIK